LPDQHQPKAYGAMPPFSSIIAAFCCFVLFLFLSFFGVAYFVQHPAFFFFLYLAVGAFGFISKA